MKKLLGNKQSFAHEKSALLNRLLSGCDNSPKGTIDAPILPLVDMLNGDEHFVTTSTCSGRISIFASPVENEQPPSATGGVGGGSSHPLPAPAPAPAPPPPLPLAPSNPGKRSKGHGKGGAGRWLLSSHTAVTKGSIKAAIESINVTQNGAGTEETAAAGEESEAQAYDAVLKHEPAILHVRCVDLRWAEWLLKVALSAGFRESGIVPGKTKVMVAIRTTSTILEVPLVLLGRPLCSPAAAVDQDFYDALEGVANRRFRLNQARLVRLEGAVRDALAKESAPLPERDAGPHRNLQGSLQPLESETSGRRRGDRRNERRRLRESDGAVKKAVPDPEAQASEPAEGTSRGISRWGAAAALMATTSTEGQKGALGSASPSFSVSLLLFGGYGRGGGTHDGERSARRRRDTVIMRCSPRTPSSKVSIDCEVAQQSPLGAREFCALAGSYRRPSEPSCLQFDDTRSREVGATSNGCAFCKARSCPLTIVCDDATAGVAVTDSESVAVHRRAYCSRFCLAAHRNQMRSGSRQGTFYENCPPASTSPTSARPFVVLFGGRRSPREALSDTWFRRGDDIMGTSTERRETQKRTDGGESGEWVELVGGSDSEIYLERWPAARWGHTLTAIEPETSTRPKSSDTFMFLLLGGRDEYGAVSDGACAFLLIGEGEHDKIDWRWKRISSEVTFTGFHHTATVISSPPNSPTTVVAVYGGWSERDMCHPSSRLLLLEVTRDAVRLRRNLCVTGARTSRGTAGPTTKEVRRGGHAAVSCDQHLCVLGGAGDGFDGTAHDIGPAFMLRIDDMLTATKRDIVLESISWATDDDEQSWRVWGDCFVHGEAFNIPSTANSEEGVPEHSHLLLLGGGLPCFAFGPVFVPATVVSIRHGSNRSGPHVATSQPTTFPHFEYRGGTRNPQGAVDGGSHSIEAIREGSQTVVDGNPPVSEGGSHQFSSSAQTYSESVECIVVPPKSAKRIKVALEAAGILNKAFRIAPAQHHGAVHAIDSSPVPVDSEVVGARNGIASREQYLAVPILEEGAVVVDNAISELSKEHRPKSNGSASEELALALFDALSGAEQSLRPATSSDPRAFPLLRQSCVLPPSKVRLNGQRAKLETAVLDLLWRFHSDRRAQQPLHEGYDKEVAAINDRHDLLPSVRSCSLFCHSQSSVTPSSSKHRRTSALEKVGKDAVLLPESTLRHAELCAPPFDVLIDFRGNGRDSKGDFAHVNRSRGVQQLWAIIAAQLNCRLVCRAAAVDSGPKRQSRIRILYSKDLHLASSASSGKSKSKSKSKRNTNTEIGGIDVEGWSLSCGPDSAGWVTVKENGVAFSFDITRVMFCSGNVTERTRMAAPPVHDRGANEEVIVDLYAGIGYYSVPFLVHHKRTKHVHCCEWNPDSLVALRFNLEANGVDPSRYTIHAGDNRLTMGFVVPSNTSDLIGGSGLGGSGGKCSTSSAAMARGTDQRKTTSLCGIADRVNLGLIPSSEEGWPLAVAALKPTGGWVHVHDNVKDGDVGAWSTALCATFTALGKAEWGGNHAWAVSCVHVERVKSYAPHVLHVVADLWIEPQ